MKSEELQERILELEKAANTTLTQYHSLVGRMDEVKYLLSLLTEKQEEVV